MEPQMLKVAILKWEHTKFLTHITNKLGINLFFVVLDGDTFYYFFYVPGMDLRIKFHSYLNSCSITYNRHNLNPIYSGTYDCSRVFFSKKFNELLYNTDRWSLQLLGNIIGIPSDNLLNSPIRCLDASRKEQNKLNELSVTHSYKKYLQQGEYSKHISYLLKKKRSVMELLQKMRFQQRNPSSKMLYDFIKDMTADESWHCMQPILIDVLDFLSVEQNREISRFDYHYHLGVILSRAVSGFEVKLTPRHVEKTQLYLYNEDLNKDFILKCGLWMHQNVINHIFFDVCEIQEQNLSTTSGVTKATIFILFDNKFLPPSQELPKLKLKSKGPLLVKPRPWLSTETNIAWNYTGGNGLIPLGIKNKNGLSMTIPYNSRLWSGINTFQQTAYELNCYLCEFLAKHQYLILNKLSDEKKQEFLLLLESIAEFKDYSQLYMLISIDSRGRFNVGNIDINYIQSKLIRSLLRFKKKSPIDSNGVILIKRALVSYYYNNKQLSINESLQIFDAKILPEIKLFFENNMEHNFWLDAHEPYFFLAGIFEYWNNSVILDYQSGYILWLDATMSCIQNLSCYLKNSSFLPEVNLIPQDFDSIPGDFYLSVLQRFLKTNDLPKLLTPYSDPKTLRSVFKNGIMTILYGVSMHGFVSKICLNVKKLDPEIKDLKPLNLFSIRLYKFIMKFDIIKSLSIFSQLMRYLVSLNRNLLLYVNSSGISTNPENADAIINIRYNEVRTTRVTLSGYSRRVVTVKSLLPDQYSARKTGTASLANFGHVGDSTFLSQFMIDAGILEIDFAAVHDCIGMSVHNWNTGGYNLLKRTYIKLFVNNKHTFESILDEALRVIKKKDTSSFRSAYSLENGDIYFTKSLSKEKVSLRVFKTRLRKEIHHQHWTYIKSRKILLHWKETQSEDPINEENIMQSIHMFC